MGVVAVTIDLVICVGSDIQLTLSFLSCCVKMTLKGDEAMSEKLILSMLIFLPKYGVDGVSMVI